MNSANVTNKATNRNNLIIYVVINRIDVYINRVYVSIN